MHCGKCRASPPGIEWKTGRNAKMGKNWPKKENGPRPEMGKKNGPKMAKKWKNDPKSHYFAIFGPCFPHFGPRAIFFFWPIFAHFCISARFPFYTRLRDISCGRFAGNSRTNVCKMFRQTPRHTGESPQHQISLDPHPRGRAGQFALQLFIVSFWL